MISELIIHFGWVFIEKITPKPITYVDGTADEWNVYTGARKFFKLAFFLSTQGWIYYFFMNLLLNPEFAINFRQGWSIFNSSDGQVQPWETTYQNVPNIMFWLFGLNVLILLFWILRALFVIRTRTDDHFLDVKLMGSYLLLNSFEEHYLDEKFEIQILKNKRMKKTKFLIIRMKIIPNRVYLKAEDFPKPEKSYPILNKSENFEEVLYHFNALKEKTEKNNI
jgi:hypothetical protein